ncbi:MAG: site-specific DNA-methyltransferase [Bacillota bacterium]|nr:site-specific DNA-methyltransferase [Bacillota bacterium]
MARGRKNVEKRAVEVTRYTYEQVKEPLSPETGQTNLLPSDEQTVVLPLDNGWSKAITVGKLPEGDDRPVVVDLDPSADPVLFWAGKRNRREVPVLPLQRNEIISESRIAQIIERARRAAEEKESQQQMHLTFHELEKNLRESEKGKRVEFYTHEEGWKNKLICGDSLHVMESLLHYENLRGKVQMIYFDPPYGIKYDSNFQQRVDSTKNDDKDRADDVLTIKAFRDTWALGIHSYLSYLQERLYVCRELLAQSGSIFLQIGDENTHLVRTLLDEIFGAGNFVAEIVFFKTSGKGASGLDAIYDRLLWYGKDKSQLKYHQLYMPRPARTLNEQYTLVELADGTVRRITDAESQGLVPLPPGSRRFMPGDVTSQGESEGGSEPFEFEGRRWRVPPGRHWSTPHEGLRRLAAKGRLIGIGDRLRYRRYADDFPVTALTNVWDDTVISGFSAAKVYVVQTSPKVVERCILMTTDPGDLVFDPTCGSGTTAFCAEKLGRRWITCDTARVSVNVARQRLLAAVFEHYQKRNGTVSGGFLYKTVDRVTLKSLAYDLEPEKVELVDQPLVDKNAIRVTGPFEIMTLGRYSVEDWKGYVVAEAGAVYGEPGKLENYIEVICRLYRKNAATQGAGGLVHAIAESETEKIAISVGPLAGRVTAKQINDAVQDALSAGILEVHVLGWAFEANVGEVKSQLEARGRVKVELIMIRPDTLVEGLKAPQPEMLFSPLALPDVELVRHKDGTVSVKLVGVALFDRKSRSTDYKRADSGYISAWYLDEDYDGDCFVDCQMFFDFKKAPNLKATVGTEVDADEFRLQLESQPFPVRGYKRVAVKVVDVFGNESTVVKDLA